MKIRRPLVALAAATSLAVAGTPAASAATYPEPLNQVMDQMVRSVARRRRTFFWFRLLCPPWAS